MDKKTGLEILEKMLGMLSEDGITDVICFAAEVQKRDENPDTLKKRLIAAREQVEMLGAMEAVLGGFAKKREPLREYMAAANPHRPHGLADDAETL